MTVKDAKKADPKPIRTAAEIRSATAGTVTSLRADMKKTSAALARAVVSEVTGELFRIASDPSVDGPYDPKGQAAMTVRLDVLPSGKKVVEWLGKGKTLPVELAPLLEDAIRSAFKSAAQLDVVNYSVGNTLVRELGYTRRLDDSFTLSVTVRDPEYVDDPVLSAPSAG